MPRSLLETSCLQSYEQYLVLQSLECHVSPREWCHVACQPSPEPPTDHQSTVVNNGSQRWPTTVNTVGPQPDHRSTVVDRQSTSGSWSGMDRVLGRVRSGLRPGQAGSWAGSGLGREGDKPLWRNRTQDLEIMKLCTQPYRCANA
ncbi:hypothetical protein Tco_0963316 [Tanacetum coccineum]